MNNEQNNSQPEKTKRHLKDSTGKMQDDMVMELEDDIQINAGKDRVGFVNSKQKIKKGRNNERY